MVAGANPLFPPRFIEPAQAKQAILEVVRRDPRQFGIEGTRWTLEAIHQYCDWLRVTTKAGVAALLHRLEVVWKRGREHVHSPDPDYEAKVLYADFLVAQARVSEGRLVTLYQDEFGFYRQPTLANAWEERGRPQPLAERSYRSNTLTRIVGLLDAVTGRFIYRRRAKIGLTELVGLYKHVRQVYPDAERIYVILDNWPVHFHPDVLVALEPQENRWPLHRPGNWSPEANPSAQKRYGDLQLPIQLVPLPTYAPWTDPVEDVWRLLKQKELHLHRLADKLDELRERVDRFFAEYANGSLELLRYVGLLDTG
jgi:DDE superfamily endonuclease